MKTIEKARNEALSVCEALDEMAENIVKLYGKEIESDKTRKMDDRELQIFTKCINRLKDYGIAVVSTKPGIAYQIHYPIKDSTGTIAIGLDELIEKAEYKVTMLKELKKHILTMNI